MKYGLGTQTTSLLLEVSRPGLGSSVCGLWAPSFLSEASLQMLR